MGDKQGRRELKSESGEEAHPATVVSVAVQPRGSGKPSMGYSEYCPNLTSISNDSVGCCVDNRLEPVCPRCPRRAALR